MKQLMAVALISASALAHAGDIALIVPGSYTSGADYQKFPFAGRQRLVEGVVGGLMTAPLVASSQASQAQAIHDCINTMKIGSKDATVMTDKFLSSNPSMLVEGVGPVVYYALKDQCAKGGTVLR